MDINELRRASVDGRSSSSGFDAASGVPGVASYGTAGLDLRSRSFDGGRPSAVPRLQLPPILDDASPGLSKRSSLAHDQAPLVPVRGASRQQHLMQSPNLCLSRDQSQTVVASTSCKQLTRDAGLRSSSCR